MTTINLAFVLLLTLVTGIMLTQLEMQPAEVAAWMAIFGSCLTFTAAVMTLLHIH